MHPRSVGLQHINRPVAAVCCFEHHLGVGAGVLELQSKRDWVVDDQYRRELLIGLGLAHNHRPLPMQIDPDELLCALIVHRGLP